MSQSIARQLKNSILQVMNGIGNAGLNFIVIVVYARFLGPENFGQFVFSQSQVLVWIILVDLGMIPGLITALHRAQELKNAGASAPSPEKLLRQTLAIRMAAAALGTGFVAFTSWFSFHDRSILIRDLAFTPHLFAYGLQYTMASYLIFQGKLPVTVFANLVGVLTANSVALFLVFKGASVPTLLLAQSWGGALAALVMKFSHSPATHTDPIPSADSSSDTEAPSTPETLESLNSFRAIWVHSWPNLVIFGTIVLWSRLDQIAAARWVSFEAAGQYGLAVRLVAIPALMASSVQFALFSDFQRIGRDAPEKVSAFVGAVSKFLTRYGAILSALILFSVGFAVLPFLPKYRAAIHLLPGFIPGIWAYLSYNALIGSLLGSRKYREVIRVHFLALAIFLIALPVLTLTFGLHGVIGAYDIFAISLTVLCYRALKRVGVLPQTHRLFGPYSSAEFELMAKVRSKFKPFNFGVNRQ